MGKGKAEGCAACAKWCLIIFNVLFCLIGVGLIAAGTYVYITLRDYLDFFEDANVNGPAIALIVIGCIVFIIAAIGCIGACKESACLLFTFAVIIGALLIAEIVVGIVAVVYKDKVKENISKGAAKLMLNYDESVNDGVRASWDLLQSNLSCCGVNGRSDWSNRDLAPKQAVKSTPVPSSCGPNTTIGCVDRLYNYTVTNLPIIGGVGIGFGIIQLLGIVLACCVGCAARKGQYA